MLANRKFADVIGGQSARIRSKWRKAITGDETKRIRDHLQEVPRYVKLMDKIAFTLGLLNILAVEYFLLKLPNYFWVWYVLIIPILLFTRAVLFRSRGWQYFMLDFCYFTLGCTLLNLLVFWDSSLLFRVVFIYTNGPLTWAIVIWRNSLVFHDYDKITSVYIHLLPSILYYTGRWYGHSSILQTDTAISSAAGSCTLPVSTDLPAYRLPSDSIGASEIMIAALGYLIWQVCYFIKTEVADRAKLDSRPELLTSLRWLSSDTKNAFVKAVLKLCRKSGILRPDEEFNSRENKTKIVFIATQFLYTLLTFLPTPLLYRYASLHAFYIIFIFTTAAFYGAGFYIEVFSRTYVLQFNKQSELQRVAEAAAEVAYEVATSSVKHRGGETSTPRSISSIQRGSSSSKGKPIGQVVPEVILDTLPQLPLPRLPETAPVPGRTRSITTAVGEGSPITVRLLREGARHPDSSSSSSSSSSLPLFESQRFDSQQHAATKDLDTSEEKLGSAPSGRRRDGTEKVVEASEQESLNGDDDQESLHGDDDRDGHNGDDVQEELDGDCGADEEETKDEDGHLEGASIPGKEDEDEVEDEVELLDVYSQLD